MKRLTSAVIVVGLIALHSCTIGTEPGAQRGLGLVIEGEPPMTSLIAPSTVQAGAPFQVTASTFGSSTCTKPHGYQLDVLAGRVAVRLYDLTAPPQTICTDDLRGFARILILRFDMPGTSQVAVIGRGWDSKTREILQAVTVVP